MAECICNTGPGTEGPDEMCPVHGRRCTFNDHRTCVVIMDDGNGRCCREYDQYGFEARVKWAKDELIDAAMSAVLDPGAHVKRGPDYDDNAYREPMGLWQRRALGTEVRTPTQQGESHRRRAGGDQLLLREPGRLGLRSSGEPKPG